MIKCSQYKYMDTIGTVITRENRVSPLFQYRDHREEDDFLSEEAGTSAHKSQSMITVPADLAYRLPD